jgi:chorismate mutase/prephenate dehydratase
MRFILCCLAALCLFAQDQPELTRALSPARVRIDHVDDQIVALLNERAAIVREVGVIKTRFHAPASAPAREQEVLRRVAGLARAPLTPEAVRRIYQALLREMTALEQHEMEKARK